MEEIQILLIEDNLGDVRLLEIAINSTDSGKIDVANVPTLAEALAYLSEHPVDLVLTDLNLPDSAGYETFLSLKAKFPDCPIVILSGVFDDTLAIKAIKDGAQDFLLKGEYNKSSIVRVIRYAIERKQTETNRNAALVKAEQATHAKSQFLAAMSHELRTPMTGVIGMADLLLETNLSTQQQIWANSIKLSGNNLLNILNEILDQSKLEAGKLEISPTDFHLLTFLEETIQFFRPGVEAKGIELNVELSDDLPETVRADRLRIGQVLSNLLSNALKFTETGIISLQIGLASKDDTHTKLHFSVRDSGIGIDIKEQDNLFSAFTQADSSTSRKFGGTGLGLSISKQLVELMGGAIGVESKADSGSTFWFTVNCLPALEKIARTDKKEGNIRWAASRKLKILIAEDVVVNQLLIRAILENLNHSVTVADNGEAAVNYIQTDDTFDLILMDVRMPVMDGLEATSAIRSLGSEKSNIPIIALTADLSVDNIQQYTNVGMNDVCGKPINLPALLKTIDNLLGEDIHHSI